MKAFLKKYNAPIATTGSSILSVLLAVGSNYLYGKLTQLLDEKVSPVTLFVIGAVFFCVTILLFFAIACLAQRIKQRVYPESWDDRYMKHAFLHLKELGANRQESFQESLPLPSPAPSNQFLVDELAQCMNLTIKSCYAFFNSAFSETGELVDDIRFEVTFMTKSYRDGEITIPFAANKENRTPVSMLLRKENIQIFSKTETARVYRMDRPTMILIEDTNRAATYEATYKNQKDRIRSTVILPVLSHRYELLGTLVVHCDRPGFFKEARRDFWRELLEVFSVELGYYKLMLDYYISNDKSLEKPF